MVGWGVKWPTEGEAEVSIVCPPLQSSPPLPTSPAESSFPPSQLLLPASCCLGFPWMLSRLHAQISTLGSLLNLHLVLHMWPKPSSASWARNLLQRHSLGRACTHVLTSPPVYDEPLRSSSTINPACPIVSTPLTSLISSLESLNRVLATATRPQMKAFERPTLLW